MIHPQFMLFFCALPRTLIENHFREPLQRTEVLLIGSRKWFSEIPPNRFLDENSGRYPTSGMNISKAALFQWVRFKSPRPERPRTFKSNLRAKEAENRHATRDQAHPEGEIVLIWRSQAPVLKFLLFN